MSRTILSSIRFSLLAALAAITLVACGGDISSPLPGTVVYKTKANYDDKVPINLNDTKTAVSSYPSPTDVITDGVLRTPTALHKSYLKDNRGVGADNSVFTSYTYTQYSQLSWPPSLTELCDSIIDFDPFTELWVCPPDASADELDQWIDANQLAVVCKQVL